MADTKPQPKQSGVSSRLQGRLEEYLRQRRKQRGKAAMALFGIDTEPTVSEMAEYNRAMMPAINDVIALQGKMYDSAQARSKDRAKVLGDMLSNVRALIDSRARNSSGMAKAKLMAHSRNVSNMLKGLDLAQSGGTQRLSDTAEGQDKIREYAAAAVRKATSVGGQDPQGAGVTLGQKLGDPQDRALAMQYVAESIRAGGKGVPGFTSSDRDVIKQGMDGIPQSTLQLQESDIENAGLQDATSEDLAYVSLGKHAAVSKEDIGAAFLMEKQMIDATQGGYGGSFGATMAELISATTSGQTTDVQEALDDLVGQIGLSPDEAATVTNQDMYQEMLLGQLYNPNAPSAVEQARDQLLQDPGFLKYKESMGFHSDRAAFKSLKKQLRRERRRQNKEDRQLLRYTGKSASPQAISALKALQENEDAAKKEADDAVASSSAKVVQPASPESTSVKTGGIGGRTQNTQAPAGLGNTSQNQGS